jgi:hypothetical protein
MRRAIWNRSSALSELGNSATIRLCSRAKSVCVEVSAMFSLARTSPATTPVFGFANSRPSEAIVGAADGLPRAVRCGR